jgi:hypothetical protein
MAGGRSSLGGCRRRLDKRHVYGGNNMRPPRDRVEPRSNRHSINSKGDGEAGVKSINSGGETAEAK